MWSFRLGLGGGGGGAAAGPLPASASGHCQAARESVGCQDSGRDGIAGALRVSPRDACHGADQLVRRERLLHVIVEARG